MSPKRERTEGCVLFQDGKDLLLGANSKSPTVMGKDLRLVDADRL